MMKFLIADDHQLILKGFKDVIQRYFSDAICDTVQSYSSLLQTLKSGTYDILFLDIRLGRDDARTFTKKLVQQYPNMPIIIISSLSDNVSISTILAQGAKAYVLKTDDEAEIVKAVQQVQQGEIFLSKDLQQVFIENNLKLNPKREIRLSKREKEVLQLIANEYSTKDIAKELFLSTKTIENHRSNLFVKFDVKNVAGLMRKAVSRGFV